MIMRVEMGVGIFYTKIKDMGLRHTIHMGETLVPVITGMVFILNTEHLKMLRKVLFLFIGITLTNSLHL